MGWTDEVISELVAAKSWNYHRFGSSFTEPAALAALALLGEGCIAEAMPLGNWLASLQNKDGSLGISETESAPKWPTALGLSVWSLLQTAAGTQPFQDEITSAIKWATSHHGVTFPRSETYGHDTTLLGWPWAMGTHAWLEPTCLFVMALRISGFSQHLRSAEGIRIIKDRQLPRGGFNYGNTLVLGQQLQPHPQPTGLALLALSGAKVEKPFVQKSIDFLKSQWPQLKGTASLCYASLGLSAYGETPRDLDRRLEAIWGRSGKNATKESFSKRIGIYGVALLLLASQRSKCLLLPQPMTVPA